MTISRRRLMFGGAAAAVSAIAAACTGRRNETAQRGQPPATSSPETRLQPTPACADADDATLAQTEGPFFTPDSPEKTDLAADVAAGTRLVLTGAVLSTECRPVAGALLDFWQADDGGNYDNEGYRLRGHQFAKAGGRYELNTIVPGLYPGRTRHIHVKVQARGGPVLTTQLYLPGEPANDRDGIYDPQLLMDVRDTPDGKEAAFTFVVET